MAHLRQANIEGFLRHSASTLRSGRDDDRLGMISPEMAETLPSLGQLQQLRAGKGHYYWSHGGRFFRCKYSGRCLTCRHPQADEINRLLFHQFPPSDILMMIGESEDGLTSSNIYEHSRRHLPPRTWIATANSQRMAQRLGMAYDEVQDVTASAEQLAHLVIERAFVGVSNGEIELKVTDAFRAAEFLAMRNQTGVDPASYADLLSAVLAVFRDVMPYEEFQTAMWTLNGNQGVQSLIHVLDVEHGDRVLERGTQAIIDVESVEVEGESAELDPAVEPAGLLAWIDGG